MQTFNPIKMKKIIRIKLFVLCSLIAFSCDTFLDEKPDQKLAVPNSLEDLEAILNNANLLNHAVLGIGEAASDNISLTDAQWRVLSESDRNLHVWRDPIIPLNADVNNAWQRPYQNILYMNTILEVAEKNRDKLEKEDPVRFGNIVGKAYFYRAFYYLGLVNTWSEAFGEKGQYHSLGIPLRLTSDFNQPSKQASVSSCYLQVEKDLKIALTHLPVITSQLFSPSKAAGYALMSRLYMGMQRYKEALVYADSCLALKNEVYDYNKLDLGKTYPFTQFNSEVLFVSAGMNYVAMRAVINGGIDTLLYHSYDEQDLRKKAFFIFNQNRSVRFRGSYYGSSAPFTGLAIDEVLLNKAECLVRRGQVGEGLEVLNGFLVNRYVKNKYIPNNPSDERGALLFVLDERRKQLLMRDVRWWDLKRLNKEGKFLTRIERKMGDDVFILEPNDVRYVLPLPENVKGFIQ